jgi:hypothetical protein
MTTMMLQARPLALMLAPKMRVFYSRFLHTLDAFAATRLRNAPPKLTWSAADTLGGVELADALQDHPERN